jgi:hypothetical protein
VLFFINRSQSTRVIFKADLEKAKLNEEYARE